MSDARKRLSTFVHKTSDSLFKQWAGIRFRKRIAVGCEFVSSDRLLDPRIDLRPMSLGQFVDHIPDRLRLEFCNVHIHKMRIETARTRRLASRAAFRSMLIAPFYSRSEIGFQAVQFFECGGFAEEFHNLIRRRHLFLARVCER
jgi:hypothetical protein